MSKPVPAERLPLTDIRIALKQLAERIEIRRRLETRGTADYREWTDDLTKARDLIDLIELAQANEIML